MACREAGAWLGSERGTGVVAMAGRERVRASRRTSGALVATLLALAALGCAQSASSRSPTVAVAAQDAGPCTKVAAPQGGSDGGGSRGGVVQRLVGSLRPGQVGCLRGGTYVEDVTLSRSNISLRSYPGETARVVGRLWVQHSASRDVLSGLALDGRNRAELPSPTVNGSATKFVGDDVTNVHTNICFLLGSNYGQAVGTVIERSRIHDCGRLPPSNHDHGIYVERASGTRILGNLIYDNADRGIQLYPNAQRTLIEGNVIDGNGEGIIFSGDFGLASSGNLVQYNVIANSRVRSDVESFYPRGNPIGVGNVVRNNCLFGGREGTANARSGGFSLRSNVIADPGFAGASSGNFQIAATSPCAPLLRGRLPLAPVAAGARH